MPINQLNAKEVAARPARTKKLNPWMKEVWYSLIMPGSEYRKASSAPIIPCVGRGEKEFRSNLGGWGKHLKATISVCDN
jgi:hypothetical protein